MKVILLRDVKGVGKMNEVTEAKDGYALNFLIPKKLASVATPAAIKDAELRRAQIAQKNAVTTAILAENIAALADAHIVIKAKANEKNHLYDAVGESEIRKAIQEQSRIELPEGAIKLERPIKEIGTFDVSVAAGEVFGRFNIIIEAE